MQGGMDAKVNDESSFAPEPQSHDVKNSSRKATNWKKVMACCFGMLISIAIIVGGIITLTDDPKRATLLIQSIAFLVCQSFVLIRNGIAMKNYKDDDFRKPSPLYMSFLIIFALVALVTGAYNVPWSWTLVLFAAGLGLMIPTSLFMAGINFDAALIEG